MWDHVKFQGCKIIVIRPGSNIVHMENKNSRSGVLAFSPLYYCFTGFDVVGGIGSITHIAGQI